MSGGKATRVGLLVALAAFGWVKAARAEVVLVETPGGLVFYTEGRVGGFFEAVTGQTMPTGYDQNGNLLHTIGDGGIPIGGLNPTLPMGAYGQGTLNTSRVRSGFMSNVLAFGLRRKITPNTTVRGYFSIWADIETENERAYYPLNPDVREGYLKVEGPGGGLLAGRSLTLFSRGATEIDFLYGHRYGVGNPAGFSTQGPSGGFVGFGVLAATFTSGIVYNTPSLAGLVLTVGYFDPARFVGLYYERTQWGRVEAELTYDHELGNLGRIHLFANGAYQKVYANDSSRSADIWGGGAGGRLELSIFRLGVATHYGQGLGFAYALDGSNANLEVDHTQELRKFDGLYAQTMVVIHQVDVSLGAGITRVHEVPADVDPQWFLMNGSPPISVLKQRVGVAAAVVYHVTDYLHLDVDYFRATMDWWLGERQVVNTYNAGATFTW
jgi:hypothetical protein